MSLSGSPESEIFVLLCSENITDILRSVILWRKKSEVVISTLIEVKVDSFSFRTLDSGQSFDVLFHHSQVFTHISLWDPTQIFRTVGLSFAGKELILGRYIGIRLLRKTVRDICFTKPAKELTNAREESFQCYLQKYGEGRFTGT